MKISIIIDKNHDEEIKIYAHERSDLINQIEGLVLGYSTEITAYKDKEIFRLNLSDIHCFITENNRLFAITDNDKLLLKLRLYNLEETLPIDFIKINKSCIANVNKIERFNALFSGTLQVKFKNGYTDYVSRRCIKTVKERLGL